MKPFLVKSPTKIIIAGEHAVVYGFPAIICTIKKYCLVSIKPALDKTIYYRDSFLQTEFSLSDLAANKINVASAPALVLSFLQEKKHAFNPQQGFFIDVISEVPVGGLGTSTAYFAGMLKALCRYFKIPLRKQELYDLTVELESKFQGYQVSGADQTAIVYPGLYKFQKQSDQSVKFSKIAYRPPFLKQCLIINTGKPVVKTGEVVKFLQNKYEAKPEYYLSIFKNIAENINLIIAAFKSNDAQTFYLSIKKTDKLLRKLGVVSLQTQKLIDKVNSLGGFAKVSGAGAHKGDRSGAVICFAESLKSIEAYLRKAKVGYFKAEMY